MTECLPHRHKITSWIPVLKTKTRQNNQNRTWGCAGACAVEKWPCLTGQQAKVLWKRQHLKPELHSGSLLDSFWNYGFTYGIALFRNKFCICLCGSHLQKHVINMEDDTQRTRCLDTHKRPLKPSHLHHCPGGVRGIHAHPGLRAEQGKSQAWRFARHSSRCVSASKLQAIFRLDTWLVMCISSLTKILLPFLKLNLFLVILWFWDYNYIISSFPSLLENLPVYPPYLSQIHDFFFH